MAHLGEEALKMIFYRSCFVRVVESLSSQVETCKATEQERPFGGTNMKKLLLALFFLFVCPVLGQTQDHVLSSPIYWDANSEVDIDTYGVWRADTDCVDPVPAPLNCPGFVEVASVPQGPDPIQWTEPGPVVFVTQDYVYRVTARNTTGNESIFSNPLTIRWLNPDAPGKPGGPRTAVQVVIIVNGDENVVTANFFAGPRLKAF